MAKCHYPYVRYVKVGRCQVFGEAVSPAPMTMPHLVISPEIVGWHLFP